MPGPHLIELWNLGVHGNLRAHLGHCHFLDEETELREGQGLAQGHTAWTGHQAPIPVLFFIFPKMSHQLSVWPDASVLEEVLFFRMPQTHVVSLCELPHQLLRIELFLALRSPDFLPAAWLCVQWNRALGPAEDTREGFPNPAGEYCPSRSAQAQT